MMMNKSKTKMSFDAFNNFVDKKQKTNHEIDKETKELIKKHQEEIKEQEEFFGKDEDTSNLDQGDFEPENDETYVEGFGVLVGLNSDNHEKINMDRDKGKNLPETLVENDTDIGVALKNSSFKQNEKGFIFINNRFEEFKSVLELKMFTGLNHKLFGNIDKEINLALKNGFRILNLEIDHENGMIKDKYSFKKYPFLEVNEQNSRLFKEITGLYFSSIFIQYDIAIFMKPKNVNEYRTTLRPKNRNRGAYKLIDAIAYKGVYFKEDSVLKKAYRIVSLKEYCHEETMSNFKNDLIERVNKKQMEIIEFDNYDQIFVE